MKQPATIVLAMKPRELGEFLFGAHLELLGAHRIIRLESWDDGEGQRTLADADVIITGWGVRELTPEELSNAPRARALLHAGGGVSTALRAVAESRSIEIHDVGEVNAVPVAEYAAAMILLAGKSAFAAQQAYCRRQVFLDREKLFPEAGNFGRAVGIVGASRIGRKVIELLRVTDLRILVSDPMLSADEARALGVELVTLTELLTRCDVVSIHAPETPATLGMIGREQLALLPDGSTVINTSRGSLIDQDALLAELRDRRISAILDVTTPDVLPPGHPFFSLDNVVLTPHIAGSMGNELRRMGASIADLVAEALRA